VLSVLLACCTANPPDQTVLATTTVAAEVPAGVPLTVAVPALPAPESSLGTMAIEGRIAWGLVLDGLTSIGRDGSPQPALATSWEAVGDTTWRFQLRPGVTFQDGTTLDGETAAASLRVALDSLKRGPDPLARVARSVSRISPLEGAVEVATRGPQPLVPALLASAYMVAPSSLQGVGAGDEAPLGTGPYQVALWRGRRMQLVRWSGSWRGVPGYDPVVLSVVPMAAARANALLGGKAEVALSLPVDPVPSGDGVTTSPLGTSEVLSITFVDGSGPTDSPLVRRAMNLAVDKDAISYALRGDLEAASLWAPGGVVGYDPERIPWGFDAERAVDLLTQAGYPDGFNFTMEVVEGRVAGDAAVYAAVEGYLELAGITVDRRVIDLPAWRARIDNSNWRGDGFSLTWSAGPLADGAVPFALVGCGAPRPVACHPDTRSSLRVVRTTSDPETRQEALGTVLDATAEDPPALFLTEPVEVWGWSQAVDGIEYHNGELVLEG
jgi:peptide/nickel transport system substrate-binding protein